LFKPAPLRGTAERLPGLDAIIENPSVAGSIPPRATKNIPHETPTTTGWRFLYVDSQSLSPVYFPAFHIVV
jgi:hypothetical protein